MASDSTKAIFPNSSITDARSQQRKFFQTRGSERRRRQGSQKGERESAFAKKRGSRKWVAIKLINDYKRKRSERQAGREEEKMVVESHDASGGMEDQSEGQR